MATIVASGAKLDDDVQRIGSYQILGLIGKGGFGVVYHGICLDTGTSVAIKRIKLQGMNKDDLEAIEQEVKLLQGLRHQNIVEYRDAIRSESHLNIVLEMVENGSLSSYIPKFKGSIPENLIRMYIAQVVIGLCYLHGQGVIHRDIKGANLLCTKTGIVKLADFGVATKLNETRPVGVAGTPYWMAPEVIEMTGQLSSACDIWSLGCTVIELLTGKPPYHDLQSMSAMFRIVQDEHPPLPEGISFACRSFLLECFQKDPIRRITARDLKRSAWIKDAVISYERSADRDPADIAVFAPDRAAAAVAHAPPSANSQATTTLSSEPKQAANQKSAQLLDADDDDEDWDEEFGDSIGKGTGLMLDDKPEINVPKLADEFELEDDDDDDDDKEVIRNRGGSKNVKSAAEKDAATRSKMKQYLEDDGGDLGDMAGFDGGDGKLSRFREDDDEENFDDFLSDDVVPVLMPTPAPGGAAPKPVGTSNPPAMNTLSSSSHSLADLAAFSGSLVSRIAAAATKEPVDDEEYDPFDFLNDEELAQAEESVESRFDKLVAALTQRTTALGDRLRTSSGGDAISPLEACSRLSEMLKEHALTLRGIEFRVVIPLLESLESDDIELVLAALKLLNQVLADGHTNFQQNLTVVGLIPQIMKLSSGRQNPLEVRLEATACIRHLCCSSSDHLRRMFVACGGIPTLVGLLCEGYQKEARPLVWTVVDCILSILEMRSAPLKNFLRLFSKFGLLRSLAHALVEVHAHVLRDIANRNTAENYADVKESKEITEIRNIKSLQQDKSESNDDDVDDPEAIKKAEECVYKMCKILEMFVNGDAVVKTYFQDFTFLEILIKLIPTLPQSSVILVLKTLRQISMTSTDILDTLTSAGAIPALVRCLDSKYPENQSQAIVTLYYLCQVNKPRQTQAALAGIIPHLQRFITTNHSLNQFAYPTLFSMASASPQAQAELKKYDGAQFLVNTMYAGYWGDSAVAALGSWAINEPHYIRFVLANPTNGRRLLSLFMRATAQNVTPIVNATITLVTSAHIDVAPRLIPYILVTVTTFKEPSLQAQMFRLLQEIITRYPAALTEFSESPELVSALEMITTNSEIKSRQFVHKLAVSILAYVKQNKQ